MGIKLIATGDGVAVVIMATAEKPSDTQGSTKNALTNSRVKAKMKRLARFIAFTPLTMTSSPAYHYRVTKAKNGRFPITPTLSTPARNPNIAVGKRPFCSYFLEFFKPVDRLFRGATQKRPLFPSLYFVQLETHIFFSTC